MAKGGIDMEVNKKSGLALTFITLGGFILLGKLGILWEIIGFVMPIALIGLGYIGIKNGRTKFGWFFAILGSFILFCKLSGVLALIFAICMIAYGCSLLKKRSDSASWGERL
jgi:uncharacterized membrane protein